MVRRIQASGPELFRRSLGELTFVRHGRFARRLPAKHQKGRIVVRCTWSGFARSAFSSLKKNARYRCVWFGCFVARWLDFLTPTARLFLSARPGKKIEEGKNCELATGLLLPPARFLKSQNKLIRRPASRRYLHVRFGGFLELLGGVLARRNYRAGPRARCRPGDRLCFWKKGRKEMLRSWANVLGEASSSAPTSFFSRTALRRRLAHGPQRLPRLS